MKIKRGATIAGLDIRMRPVLIAADELWREHGEEVAITSGLDGTHSAGSLHYYGLAVDCRTRYFTNPGVTATELQHRLDKKHGSGVYDVIYHKNHIHVEYDPDKGRG